MENSFSKDEIVLSKSHFSAHGEKGDSIENSSLSSEDLNPPEDDPDSKEIRRIRWKVDRRLIPLLSILYLCSFMDRVNIGNAKIANLEADLKLSPGIYNLACSIFYIGYILGEIPANLVLKRLGPRIWIPMVMFSWGVMSMSMAGVTNGAGLLATRFFLGLAESGYAPAPIYIISLWYRRREHALRVSVYFSAAIIAGAFGGLLAYAIMRLHNYGGLHAWQWIFILEGLPTVLCCILVYLLLPDFPETSTFLSLNEKALYIKQLRIDAGPATNAAFSWPQVWAACKDWKVPAHTCIGILHGVPFASLGLFIPSITLGFGYDPITTQLMTAPIYLSACVVTFIFAVSSDHFAERGYHGAVATTLGAVGYFLLVLTRHSALAARYISLVICTCGVYGTLPVQASWASSNIGGHTKRAVAVAIIISLAQIGSVIGGQLYRESDAPLYVRSHSICGSLLLVSVFGKLSLKYFLKRENKRRELLTLEERDKECRDSDATDNHPDFRYFE